MLVFCSSVDWSLRLPTVKLKAENIPNNASSMAEIILIEIENREYLNFLKIWNIIKYRETADTVNIDVHFARFTK